MVNGTQAGIASLQTRARVVRLALWFFIAVGLLNLLFTVALLSRQMLLSDPPLEILVIGGLVNLGFWLAMLLGTVPILAWVYRAHANLHESGVGGLEFTPRWATGSYLVPFLNCVVPFRAMRELYNRSEGEPADFAQSSAAPVTNWWACHIPAVFLSVILSLMAAVPLVSNVWFTTPPAATTVMNLFVLTLWLGSAWFLLQTVNRITAAQAYGVATANVFD